MKIVTPPLRRFQQHCQRKNGWSDHYGALHSAAQYAGLEIPAQFEFNGFWQHGSFGSWSKRVPSTLVYNLEPAAFPFLVARVDEQLCLMEDGYKDVRAIGLPILYTPGLAPKRVPRSLLVVPTHTLLGATYPDRSVFEAYANEIAAIAGDFEHVVICVHPHCKTNGFWVNEFSSRGFPIIYGAQTDDRNALLRMRTLFEQFEYVTTNGWGSHIPYALAYGAKVSLHGPEPALRAENLLKDGTWRKNLEALRKASSPEVFAERRQFLERFSRCPGEGIADIEVGRYALGWANKLAPEQMRALLLELLGPTPKPMAQVSLDLEHAFLADCPHDAAPGRGSEPLRPCGVVGSTQPGGASRAGGRPCSTQGRGRLGNSVPVGFGTKTRLGGRAATPRPALPKWWTYR